MSTNHGSDKIQIHDEPHGEEAETAHLRQKSQLGQVVDGRIDPSTTLGKKDFPSVRSNSIAQGVRGKLHLEGREVFHHQGRKVSILSKGEQVLFVKSVDVGFGIVVDNSLGDDDRSSFIRCPKSVQTETTGKTSD